MSGETTPPVGWHVLVEEGDVALCIGVLEDELLGPLIVTFDSIRLARQLGQDLLAASSQATKERRAMRSMQSDVDVCGVTDLAAPVHGREGKQ